MCLTYETFLSHTPQPKMKTRAVEWIDRLNGTKGEVKDEVKVKSLFLYNNIIIYI